MDRTPNYPKRASIERRISAQSLASGAQAALHLNCQLEHYGKRKYLILGAAHLRSLFFSEALFLSDDRTIMLLERLDVTVASDVSDR